MCAALTAVLGAQASTLLTALCSFGRRAAPGCAKLARREDKSPRAATRCTIRSGAVTTLRRGGMGSVGCAVCARRSMGVFADAWLHRQSAEEREERIGERRGWCQQAGAVQWAGGVMRPMYGRPVCVCCLHSLFSPGARPCRVWLLCTEPLRLAQCPGRADRCCLQMDFSLRSYIAATAPTAGCECVLRDAMPSATFEQIGRTIQSAARGQYDAATQWQTDSRDQMWKCQASPSETEAGSSTKPNILRRPSPLSCLCSAVFECGRAMCNTGRERDARARCSPGLTD